MTLPRFDRTRPVVPGNAFIVSPYGHKVVAEGKEPHDFDYMSANVLAPAVSEAGMTPVRADDIYGATGLLMDTVWRSLQEAELVIVDFTGKAPNVAVEFALAAVIGKRMVVITQSKDDIPTDLQGMRYIHYTPDFRGMTELRSELVRHLKAAREEPSTEMCFKPYRGATPAPGEVVATEKSFAVIKLDDGGHAVLQATDCDWGRVIPDMSVRYKAGDRVEGAFDIDAKNYTLLAGQSNPWPTVETEYEVGRRFVGTVQNKVNGVGVFVKIVGPVKGLVAESSNPEVAGLERGDQVDVVVIRVDLANRRVQLRVAKPIDTAGKAPREHVESNGPSPRAQAVGLPPVGTRFEDAEVVKVAPETGSKGGFVLVTLPGFAGRALLHCSRMTTEMRADLNSGGIEVGELLPVEVYEVDPSRRKVLVRDLPDLENDEAPAA